MAGRLSQTLENLNMSEQHLLAIPNLPSEVDDIKKETSALVKNTIAEVKQVQALVPKFAEEAQTLLDRALKAVEQSESASGAAVVLSDLDNQAKSLQDEVAKLSSKLRANHESFTAFSARNAQISADLNRQKTELAGKLEAAKNQKAAAQKKYYYLLALGPFGLAGLATALGLYLDWSSKVNDIEAEQNRLHAKIVRIESMEAAMNQLKSDVEVLSTSLLSVKNSVDMVCADIQTIKDDIHNSDVPSSVLTVHINAAKTQVDVLKMDAA